MQPVSQQARTTRGMGIGLEPGWLEVRAKVGPTRYWTVGVPIFKVNGNRGADRILELAEGKLLEVTNPSLLEKVAV